MPDRMESLVRGAAEVLPAGELERKLALGRPLRVKLGIDPTAPDIHLGHTVVLRKLRDFQDAGHVVVLIIGDFTARVGDPSGRSELRPMLSVEQIDANARTYQEQAFKVLDASKVELRRNREWIDKLTADDMAGLMARYTVSRMLERNDFSARYAEKRAIHLHEFLYPLLQGYDSVALECDVELGGTDQLFNLLVGRDLMGKYGKRPQIVMTTPILEGTDARVENGQIVGKKMSKSADNYIGIQEPPEEMFRKAMQIGDDVVFRFFELLSRRTNEEIATLKADKTAGRNPMEIKALLARELVERFHGGEAATQAAREFDRVYSKDAVPDQVPVFEVAPTGVAEVAWALKQANLVASTSEARRLIEQGGVEVDGVRMTDPRHPLEPGREYLVRVGSKNRKFARIRVKGV